MGASAWGRPVVVAAGLALAASSNNACGHDTAREDQRAPASAWHVLGDRPAAAGPGAAARGLPPALELGQADRDGVADVADNCPDTPNADQADEDGDLIGDACDLCPEDAVNDPDGDGICGSVDNCPRVYNPSQTDADADGFGDACDDCSQAQDSGVDADNDGLDDACDGCVAVGPVLDSDHDNVCDDVDNCPLVYNPDQRNTDAALAALEVTPSITADALGDACDPDADGDGSLDAPDGPDPCPLDPTILTAAGQPDTDGDGLPDACDPDADGDWIPNERDNCPLRPNDDQLDLDRDGVGDACDLDRDGDSVLNDHEPGGANGACASDRLCCGDRDGDGCDDCAIARRPMPWNDGPDLDGDGLCDSGDPDADGDGVPAVGCSAGYCDDPDDRDPLRCGDLDQDGCDDCSAGHGPDPLNDGPDEDGDGLCEMCPPADDDDLDGLCNAVDPCRYSHDNDRDGDGACFVGAEPAVTATDAAAAPVSGISGTMPWVAYKTTAGTVKVLGIEPAPAGAAVVLGEVPLLAALGTTSVLLAASMDQLVIAPSAALTDEDDYYRWPYGGLRVLPFGVTAAGVSTPSSVVADEYRSSYFDCYGGRYGAPGVAQLVHLWLGRPTAWVLATVRCPTHSLYAGHSNRRVLLGGGIAGPTPLAWQVGATSGLDSVLVGDDRLGLVLPAPAGSLGGSRAIFYRSIFDPFRQAWAQEAPGYLGWRGNLSASGDAAAVQDAAVANESGPAAGWQVVYRGRPTSTLRTYFQPLAELPGPGAAAVDARLVLWVAEGGTPGDRVYGIDPRSRVRVGFPVAGDTFVAAERLIARQQGNTLAIWRWWYEDACPDIASTPQDSDRDGIPDACDLCATFAASSPSDMDRDGIGDYCDNAPYQYNPGQEDSDGDGIGDLADPVLEPPQEFACGHLEFTPDLEGWQYLICDGAGETPVFEIDTGDSVTEWQPDLSGYDVSASTDRDTPCYAVNASGDPLPAGAVLYLYIPVVNADGEPTCPAAGDALPLCVTTEYQGTFERPLQWPESCTGATSDLAGITFNYPDGGPRCVEGQVTEAFGVTCTVAPHPSGQGCLYLIGDGSQLMGCTMHPEDRPVYLVQRASNAVCSLGDTVLENAAAISDDAGLHAGHVASGGDLTMRNSTLVDGSALVGQDLSMTNASIITGDAYVGGTVTLQNTSEVQGDIFAQAWPGDLCTCGADLVGVMALAQRFNDNDRLYGDPLIAPRMQAGALVLTNTQQVTLRGGDYYLTGLTLRNTARLRVEDGGWVRLYIAGPVTMENATSLNVPVAAGSRIDIVSDYAGTHRLVNATDSVIRVYAPLAHLSLRNAADMFGSVTVGSLQVENAGALVRDIDAGDAVEISLGCQWE